MISIKAARINAGLTLEKVQEATGISRNTLAKYEAGETMPRWDTVIRLCELYACSINSIFIPRQ